MILFSVHELTIVTVEDAGLPNQERVVIRPTQSVNLGAFGLYLGQLNAAGMITPYRDQFFWFGELTVAPPSWIFVYTGPGTFRQTVITSGTDPAYVFHWWKPHTLFGRPGIVPVLMRFDAVAIGSQPIQTRSLPGT
jgi:hypothetical protein